MKRLFLLAILLGSTWFLSAQNDVQVEDVAKLKKQMIELKNKNAQLEKTLKMHSAKSSEILDSLSNQLKENTQKLAALQDLIMLREKILKHTRSTALMAIKSLKHRKKLAITGFAIAIVLFGGASWFAIRKHRADIEKLGILLSDLRKIQEEGFEKEKNERIQQFNALKETIEQRLTEQERRLADQERKISELKNKG